MAFMPTNTDDQQRQQLISNFFLTAGDLLAGTDTQPRFEPGMSYGNNGLYGPNQANADIGYGNGGEIFQRGRAAVSYGTQGAPVQAQQGLFGLPMPMVLLIAVGIYLAAR